MSGALQRESLLDFSGIAVFLAVIYNSILAVLNAHILSVNNTMVMASEAVIVAMCLSYIGLKIRTLPNIFPPLIFLLGTTLCFIFVSLANDTFFIKAFRDMLLIATFFLMGGLIGEKSLINVFRILGWLVLIFMLVENYATEVYASLFKPALYYANTRGIAEVEYNELGIFSASLGYAERFSFNFLSNHRLSSIFLEQVSLANFSMILAIFVATFWENLKKFDKYFFLILIPLIVLTNDTRTGTAICIITFFGFFLFPHLPRYVNMLYMPLMIIIAAFLFYDPDTVYDNFTDDLPGRVGNTLHFLSIMNMSYLTGGSLEDINKTWDSGYAYIIYALTIFGLAGIWLFATLCVPQVTAEQKRYIHSANIFLFANLMVSGAVFSIKVAALLWLIAGFLYYKRFKSYN